MPQKKRNSHLKTARLSKKLKNENDQNTFSYEEPFDLEPEIDDDKTICESDYYEYELSNFQLSDGDSGDDNWHSKALNSAIEKLDISIFENMVENSKNDVTSEPNHPLAYMGPFQ